MQDIKKWTLPFGKRCVKIVLGWRERKTTRFGKKLPRGISKIWEQFFSMMTASDKEVTRQNLKECWKIKACKGADDKVGQRSKGIYMVQGKLYS